jgi:hypothetical protein
MVWCIKFKLSLGPEGNWSLTWIEMPQIGFPICDFSYKNMTHYVISWLSTLSVLSVPDEGYSRNASCVLNLIYDLRYYYYHWIDTSDVEILFPDGSLPSAKYLEKYLSHKISDFATFSFWSHAHGFRLQRVNAYPHTIKLLLFVWNRWKISLFPNIT